MHINKQMQQTKTSRRSARNDATGVRWTKQEMPLCSSTQRKFVSGCVHEQEKNGIITKNDETQAKFVHFSSFVRGHTNFWCS